MARKSERPLIITLVALLHALGFLAFYIIYWIRAFSPQVGILLNQIYSGTMVPFGITYVMSVVSSFPIYGGIGSSTPFTIIFMDVLYAIVLGIVMMFVAYGLWKLNLIAFYGALTIHALGILYNIASLISSLVNDVSAVALFAIGSVVNGLIVYYLRTKKGLFKTI